MKVEFVKKKKNEIAKRRKEKEMFVPLHCCMKDVERR